VRLRLRVRARGGPAVVAGVRAIFLFFVSLLFVLFCLLAIFSFRLVGISFVRVFVHLFWRTGPR
jgi:hypothetical protein